MNGRGRVACIIFLGAMAGLCARASGEGAKKENNGNISVLVGMRLLTDDGLWNGNLKGPANLRGKFDDQPLAGLMVDITLHKEMMLGIEFGALYSMDDAIDGTTKLSGSVIEGFVGLRRTWMVDQFRPYAGFGLTFIQAAYKERVPGVISIDEDDGSIAGYGHFGFIYRVGDHFNIGGDIRYDFLSSIEFDFGGGTVLEGDANNVVFTMQFGWGW